MKRELQNNSIPIVFISDSHFVMPTCVAVTSLIVHKNEDTKYDITIILAECSQEDAAWFQKLDRPDASIHIMHVDFEKYRDVHQLEHVSIAGLIKFDICDMLPAYEKILYMDGDIIVKEDLADLYAVDVGTHYMAIVRDMEAIKENKGNAYSGLMLLNAVRFRQERFGEKLHAVRRSLGDRASMDQQTFNLATGKDYTDLDIKYCVIPSKVLDERETYPIEKINALYHTSYSSAEDLYQKAAVIHYATSNKPWKYTFMPWAKEWYRYYRMSPFRDVPFRMRGRWEYRFHEMIKALRENGIKGISGRLKDRTQRMANPQKEREIPWE